MTWTPAPLGQGALGPVTAVAFADAAHGCIQAGDSLQSTSDYGETWAPLSAADQTRSAAASGRSGLALACAAIIADPSWSLDVSGSISHPGSLAAVVGNNVVWLWSSNGVLLSGLRGARIWTEHQMPDSVSLRALSFADPVHGWLLTDGHRLLRTTDGGDTWAQVA